MIACSIGGLANVSVADIAIQHTDNWSIAGLAGAFMGAVFNFGVASNLVWSRRRAIVKPRASPPTSST